MADLTGGAGNHEVGLARQAFGRDRIHIDADRMEILSRFGGKAIVELPTTNDRQRTCPEHLLLVRHEVGDAGCFASWTAKQSALSADRENIRRDQSVIVE